MSSRPDPRRAPVDTPLVDAPLVVRTREIADPGPLLALLPHRDDPRDLVSWVRYHEGLVGWGQAARLTVSGPDRFREADEWWAELSAGAVVRDEVGVPGTGPVVFGSFPFSDHSAEEGVLVVPEVVVGCRDEVWWVTTVGAGGRFPAIPLITAAPPPSAPESVTFADGALGPDEWASAVRDAVDRISRGDLDKVVLARDLEARVTAPLDPRFLLTHLAERYPRTWSFAVDGLVGATPELLVRRDHGLVLSRVLAGTIQRTGDDSKDLALAASLARSSKDLEEHEYAVRSVAEALATHCSSTNVPETPFVLHLSNVMHLATDVAGVSSDTSTSLSLAAALHPSAAVGGTPREAAVALIDEIEGLDRGRYAGPVGWMDASGDGEWGIALRCGRLDERDPARIRLYAGCGIVAGSTPESELAEADAKFLVMRDALEAGA